MLISSKRKNREASIIEESPYRNKMREVLGEVLSDLFAKHLPCENPSKY